MVYSILLILIFILLLIQAVVGKGDSGTVKDLPKEPYQETPAAEYQPPPVAPNPINYWERQLTHALHTNQKNDALRATHNILQKDKYHLLSNMTRAAHYFESGNYESAYPLLSWLVNDILVHKKFSLEKNIWSWLDDTAGYDEFTLLVSKTYYYYGYLVHQAGDIQNAKAYKLESRKHSLYPSSLNLY